MQKKIVFIFIVLMAIALNPLKAQDFPDKWIGKWQGDLLIYNKNEQKMKVNMELHIAKTDTIDKWNFVIIYGENEKKQTRNYVLIAKDKKKGSYQIDEKNSIILEANLHHNTLISSFVVMKNEITSIYRFEENQITFEILSSNQNSISQTGSKDNMVDIKKIENYQRAILKRKQ